MKIKSKSRVVVGVLCIFSSLWLFSGSPRLLTPAGLLAPAILGAYFILDGIFGIIPLLMKGSYIGETRRSTKSLKAIDSQWKKNIITKVKLINSSINTVKHYNVILMPLN
jgi:hypothetical protein